MLENPPMQVPPVSFPEHLAEEAPTRSLRDYLAILSRRRMAISVVAALILVVAILLATLLPPTYRSYATILVEEQAIPPDLVRSTVTSFADERIQVISEQVMTRPVLLSLVDKYKLYSARRAVESNEEILDRMRKDIKLEPVNARVTDRSSGGQVNATIAFQVSYDSRSPQDAQRVTNELVTLYLNENVKNRQQRAAETSAFLSEEAERLGAQISESESKLADFKQRNQGRLPEETTVNMGAIDRANSDLTRIGQDLSRAEDRKIQLTTEIAQARALTQTDEHTDVMDPAERLRYLEDQLAGMIGNYSDTHPDVIRMRREIAVLKKQLGESQGEDAADYATQIATEKAHLAELRQKYSENHPDVVKARNTLANLEAAQRAAAHPGKAGAGTHKDASGRPTSRETRFVLTMRTQLDSASREIDSLRKAREETQARIRNLEAWVSEAPQVEKDYDDLQRDHDNLVARYRELKSKQMTAEVAEQLEKDRKAERFALIDPPQLPERPISPNRSLILLVGMALCAVGGAGWALLLEAFDRSVRGVRELRRLIPVTILGTVPYVDSDDERRVHKRTWGLALAGGTVAVGALVLLVHLFVYPLPILWYVALRHLGAG